MEKIKKIDYFLIISVILSPMTDLRIWKIGPAELLVFIWCLLNYRKILKVKLNNYHFVFWLFFISSIIFGTAYGITFYPEQVFASQIFTWIYLAFISIAIYGSLQTKKVLEIELILQKISIYGTLWYTLLYIYSLLVAPTFFNASLWYGSGLRFTGGGNNPHQIAVFLSSIIFINFMFFSKTIKIKGKILYGVLILLGLFLSNETASSTLLLSIVITFGIFLFYKTYSYFPNNKQKIVKIIILVILFLIFLTSYNLFYDIFISWVSADPNGLGRFDIFSSFGDTLQKSPIVGLGPGTHAYGGIIEYHNTYLEIIAMSGVVGSVIFLIYTWKIFNKVKKVPFLFFIILPLYFYGLAGFAMRRLAYWAIFMIVITLTEKILNNSND